MPNNILNFNNLQKEKLYTYFAPNTFTTLSNDYKQRLVKSLIYKLCQEKQLVPPPITFINDQSENFGSYNSIRNTLNINLDYILDLQLKYEQEQKFKNPKDKDKQVQNLEIEDLVGKYPSFELLNVIFHELRHYEQKEKVKNRDIQKGIKYPLPSSHIHYILQPHEQDAYETAHKTLEGILVLDLKDYLLQTITNYNKSVKHAKNEKTQPFNLIDNIKDFFINKYTNNYYPEQSVSKANIKQIFNVIDNVPKEFNIDIVKNNEFIDATISDSNNKIRLFVKNGKASILLEEFKNKDTINDVIIAAKNFVDLYNLRSNIKVENIEIIPYSLHNSIIKTNSIINKINKNLLIINENNINVQKLIQQPTNLKIRGLWQNTVLC